MIHSKTQSGPRRRSTCQRTCCVTDRARNEYDGIVRQLIGIERMTLWQRCEEDSWRPKRTGAYDWKLAVLTLKKKLRLITLVASQEQDPRPSVGIAY